MIRVLHLTAHLGGGVGKALSGLAERTRTSAAEIQHTFVCFERPEKTQFLDIITACGNQVILCPDTTQLSELIEQADVVQLEWWNHPATLRALCELNECSARLIVWNHLSGLFNPIIPSNLIRNAHIALLTSACSLAANEVVSVAQELGDRLNVVSSSGGYAGLPSPIDADIKEQISVGYFGSLNFAKLHPSYVDYLAAVNLPNFKVRMIGDRTNKDVLVQQCARHGKQDMLEFRGYTTDIASELSQINVLAYLLNPEHYGTTENALLEAMATGIVPVVLDNPAESRIVENGKNGIVVRNLREFSNAMDWLAKHPHERHAMGLMAAKSVREKFTVERMESSLNMHYRSAMKQEKKKFNFRTIFGHDPSEWFLSCQGNRGIFTEDGKINLPKDQAPPFGLLEKNKGTVFHFQRNFPENQKLAMWAKNLVERCR